MLAHSHNPHSNTDNKVHIQDSSFYSLPHTQPLPPPPRSFSYRDSQLDSYSYPDLNIQSARLPYSNSRQYPSPISDTPSAAFSPVPPSGHDQVHYLVSPTPPSQSYQATVANCDLGANYDLSGPIPSVSQLKRREYPTMVDTSVPIPSQSSYQTPTSANASSPSNDGWSPRTRNISASSSDIPKRKPRREKPKIALAPDQPYTTQGKPRARVYVACVQCRNRKIRCDGAKPVCHNCGRRNNSNDKCEYDSVPRRRGPDKTPGARQRMVRDLRGAMDGSGTRRRRKRASPARELPKVSGYSTIPDVNHGHMRNSPDSNQGTHSPASSNDYTPYTPVQESHYWGSDDCACHGAALCPDDPASQVQLYSASKPTVIELSHPELDVTPIGGIVTSGYITSLDDNDQESDDARGISYEPSLNFSRKIWFDSLLALYMDARHPDKLSTSDRELATREITADLRFLFNVSNYWFSFFHLPSFFGKFLDPQKRERMQPSLVLSALAVSTFFKSSNVGLGQAGRQRALRFLDAAQGALQASLNAGFIDETLAQAAWLIALFEVCVHPDHSTVRSVSAIRMLDSIIRSLSLISLDFHDPQTTVFTPGSVPAIESSSRQQWQMPSTGRPFTYSTTTPSSIHSAGCSCLSLTLGEHWPSSIQHTPMWANTPAWDSSWSEGDIRKESCRRLCWSAITLAAGHVFYAMANHSQGLDLFIADPANFALLFSGESIIRSPSLASSKDTIWALYDRSSLLWHSCVRMRNSTSATEDERGQFAVKAWLEADAIEEALNKHTCGIEKAFIFQGREYLFNTRMCITYEYQRYIPLVPNNVPGSFHREKAEQWLNHQEGVARRLMQGLHTITGNTKNHLVHRPFFLFWFMSQISRALNLWHRDPTMTIALNTCKAFTPVVDYMSALWPCPEQRQRYTHLHQRLTEACLAADVPPPAPPNFSLDLSNSTPSLLN